MVNMISSVVDLALTFVIVNCFIGIKQQGLVTEFNGTAPSRTEISDISSWSYIVCVVIVIFLLYFHNVIFQFFIHFFTSVVMQIEWMMSHVKARSR